MKHGKCPGARKYPVVAVRIETLKKVKPSAVSITQNTAVGKLTEMPVVHIAL